MKREKGITLVSVVVYVIGIVVVVALISSLLAFYNKNMININNSSDISMEFSKFNSKLIEETNISGNSITEITTTKITFSSGNVYEFKENKVYYNSAVLSNYVAEFQANVEETEIKQILNIYILHERGDESLVHNQSYVLTLNSSNVQSTSNKILKIAPEVDVSGLAVQDTLIKPYKNSNVQIVIPEGFAPVILNGSNWTTSDPGQDGSVKEIMAPEDWLKITIDDINKGIVIVDHAITYDGGYETGTVPDFNEYVWVPIPEKSNFARVAWAWTYTNDYGTFVTVEQELSEFATEEKYWEDKSLLEYKNMVISVNENKGFYVSRYEASRGTGDTAQSKRNQDSWGSIANNDSTQEIDAIRASVNNRIENTHLMHGIEWDSLLTWIERTSNLLVTNSKNWGNYYNSVSPANNSPWERETKKNTGASEFWKANNIYDLGGNLEEWTQEKWSTWIARTTRGGNYYADGGVASAANRTSFSEKAVLALVGFRYSFFI